MAWLSTYQLRSGSERDRALLVRFMQRTYQELYPHHPSSHLAQTVDQYLYHDTPLWWVEPEMQQRRDGIVGELSAGGEPIACLWIGNAIDQIRGDRHANIFLLYVDPSHRRQGIGSALMHHAETWAKARGDRQIGLQVFQSNSSALKLYQNLGYDVQALWMVKPL